MRQNALAGQLRDDSDGSDSGLSPGSIFALSIGAVVVLWMSGFFYTVNNVVSTAPKILPKLPKWL